jgi:hypothetical protein
MKPLLAAFFLILLASASVAHSSATIDTDAQQQQQQPKKSTVEPSCPPRTLELREITVISRLVSLRGSRVLIQCATKDTAFGARQLPLQSVDVDTLFYNMARIPDLSLPVAQITCGQSVSCVVDVQARSSQLFGGYYGMPDRIFGINSDSDCWFDYESFNSPAKKKDSTNSTTTTTGNQAGEKDNTNNNALDLTSTRAPVWYCELKNRGSYALGCAECEGKPAPSDPVLDGTPWSFQDSSSSSTTPDTLSPTLIIIAGVVCCLAVVLVSTALFMKWRRYRQGDRRVVELMDRAAANGGGGGGGGGGRPTRPTFKPAEWYEIDLMEEGGAGGEEVKMTDAIPTATATVCGEEGSVHTTNNKSSDEVGTTSVDGSPGASTSSLTEGNEIIEPRTTHSTISALPSPYHKGPILVLSPGDEDSGGAVLAMGKREAVVIVNRLGEEEEGGGSSGRRRKRRQASGGSRTKESGNNENGDRVTVTAIQFNDNDGDGSSYRSRGTVAPVVVVENTVDDQMEAGSGSAPPPPPPPPPPV